jgi:hypothetical protein
MHEDYRSILYDCISILFNYIFKSVITFTSLNFCLDFLCFHAIKHMKDIAPELLRYAHIAILLFIITFFAIHLLVVSLLSQYAIRPL